MTSALFAAGAGALKFLYVIAVSTGMSLALLGGAVVLSGRAAELLPPPEGDPKLPERGRVPLVGSRWESRTGGRFTVTDLADEGRTVVYVNHRGKCWTLGIEEFTDGRFLELHPERRALARVDGD